MTKIRISKEHWSAAYKLFPGNGLPNWVDVANKAIEIAESEAASV